MEKASIRFNNPGAMWGKGNKVAAKWGSTGTTSLNDGLGQGNNIAFFPTKVIGACAQFDLWRIGYTGMTLEAAIRKWSGGNWDEPYASFLVSHTGISLSTTITPVLLAGPAGLRLMKFQAQWEAGKPYPLSDAEWAEAQRKVFADKVMTVGQKKASVGAVVMGGAAAGAAHAAVNGSHWAAVAFILVAGIITAGILATIIHQRHEEDTSPPKPFEGHP